MITTTAWYVVNSQPRRETLAVFHLANQGFEPYLPRYLRSRRHARRLETVRAPLFPGYLFVRLNSDSMRWRAIRSTIGVRDLVCHGDEPAPVPRGIVEDIQARENDSGVVVMAPKFRRGETVTVCHGALLDQIGIFESADDDERVVILLRLLGRDVRVKLPAAAVQAA